MTVRKQLLTLVLLVAMALMAACGGAAEPTPEPAPEATVDEMTEEGALSEATAEEEMATMGVTPEEMTEEEMSEEGAPEATAEGEMIDEEMSDADIGSGETMEYAIPGDAVYPEGVAFDSVSNTFFTDSTGDGTLFRGDLETGEITVFAEGGADGRTTTIGLAVDEANRRLWVAGGATQRMYVFDIETGEQIQAFQAPEVAQSFINDVAVDSAGNAYFTDSQRPVVFRVPSTAEGVGELESFIDLDGSVPYSSSFNVNGIVVTQGDEYLIINHSGNRSLFRIDLASNEVVQIETDEPVGGDGLALNNTTLYSVENNQIVEVELADDYAGGTIVQRFDDPSFKRATTIAQIGDRLLVVNSQFDARGSGNPSLPFTITDMSIPMGEGS